MSFSYSEYLANKDNKCCRVPINGQKGIQGPAGYGPIGPVGYTGLSGVSFIGPTGVGCTGPTGSKGSSNNGITGAVGPTGLGIINTDNIINLSFDPNQTTLNLLPSPQIYPITYYSVDLQGGNINSINTNNLPKGYQAIIYITNTAISQSGLINSNINGQNNVFSNINSSTFATTINNSVYIQMKIISDGTNYYTNIIQTYV
jgi:hypothetical protein